MPDRLKYIQIVFEDDGISPRTIKREYKSVHFAGEGSPREVDITEEERLAFFAAANAQNSGLMAEAYQARADALAALEPALAELEKMRTEREVEREAMKVSAAPVDEK